MQIHGDGKKIADFWQELAMTIEQLLESREENQFEAENLLNEYRDKLQRIDENLTFHFEADDDGPIEMIFGCDGYPESIHSVLSLVGAAPDVKGVTFKAFNNRYDPIPNSINVGGESCELADFWFSLRPSNRKLHLSIYLKDMPLSLDMDPRIEAVMIFLDALIGEYELMTKVWTLDWFELPIDPVDYALQPLSSLRESFDQLKRDVPPIGLTFH